MMINYSKCGKNYSVLLCSMPNLIPTELQKRPLKFTMLHNLFYILPLCEILLYSFVLLQFLLSFFPLLRMCLFLSFFLYPFIMANFPTFCNIREKSSFIFQINSITEINITALNVIELSGWSINSVWLKGDRFLICYFEIMKLFVEYFNISLSVLPEMLGDLFEYYNSLVPTSCNSSNLFGFRLFMIL
jgi:hypothetical protein